MAFVDEIGVEEVLRLKAAGCSIKARAGRSVDILCPETIRPILLWVLAARNRQESRKVRVTREIWISSVGAERHKWKFGMNRGTRAQ